MGELKLKSCPFCGGQAEFTDYGEPGEFEDWSVYCRDCGVSIIAPGDEPGAVVTKEEAAKVWNQRAVPKTTRILADVLDGTPLLFPCSKLFEPDGWCKEHCKTQEPDAECWLKYVEVLANEQQTEGE